MNTEIKDKITKVLELANRGIDGEKDAAEKTLERLMKKYNLSDEDLAKIKLKPYTFTYKTNLDKALFFQLKSYFFKDKSIPVYGSSSSAKQMVVELEYLDFVKLDSAYEYFRRHAAKQFNEFCLPHINRCRTAKTKNAKRADLQDAFFSKYVIASNIYHQDQVREMTPKEMEEARKKAAILGNVEGGKYHTQVSKPTKQIG